MPVVYTHYNTDKIRIKRVCNIEALNLDFDDDLDQALQNAYHFINNTLARYTTVPLTGTIPDMIIRIEADIGGGLYKEEKVEPAEGERVKKHILRERGEVALLEFIKTNYEASGSRRSSFFRCSQKSTRMRIDAGPLEEDD